jgi:hypothetical protein
MKSPTVIPIGTSVLVVILVLALTACAVFPAQPSPEPGVFQLSPLAPTAAPVVARSLLPTPTPTSRLAPDFSLLRENGQKVRLSEFRDKSSVVLVFYRGQT